MERIQHDLIQGSDAWHQFRAEHDGASEAAAALGISTKSTRSELLFAKHTGLPKVFSQYVQEKVLERGHQVEALARPIIEDIIGASLYPQTYSYGRLSASCDGLTSDDRTAFECKQWAEALAAAVMRGELPEEHQPQCQQVMHVTGAERLIFAVTDGTLANTVHMLVLPDPAWVKRIEAGWAQFHKDLQTYVPPEVIPALVAAPIKDLPAVVLTVSGALTIETNFAAWGVELRSFIDRIPEKPETDQEFADCKAAIVAFKSAEAQLDAEEKRVLSMVADIDEMQREKKLLRDLSSTTRLALEKMVVRRDLEVKTAIMQAGKDALAAHSAGLNKRLAKVQMPPIPADFAVAIKNKRNLESMRGAVADLVAAKKIESNEIADKITINLQALHDGTRLPNADYSFLFSDYAQLILKAPDDLALVIKSRIADHQAAEAARLESERATIRKEEEDRAAATIREAAADAERQRLAGIASAAKIEQDRTPPTLAAVPQPTAEICSVVPEPAPQAALISSGGQLDETPAAAATTFRSVATGAARLRDEIDELLIDCTAAELEQIIASICHIKKARKAAA